MASPSPFQYYLKNVFSEAGFMPSLGSLWQVEFHTLNEVTALKSSASYLNALENWQTQSSDVLSTILERLETLNSGNYVGCVFARSVNIPGEKITASRGPLKYGGYMAPAVIDNRSGYEPVNIKFLETNFSFIDNIIRPWSIMTGYYGMLTRDPELGGKDYNVKCPTMIVTQFMLGGSERSMIRRKEVTFWNVAPISVGTTNLVQAGESLLETEASFVYEKYEVKSFADRVVMK
jgi:hypothetical protein